MMRRTGMVNGIFLLLAVFNLLISFGAIWSLQRIEPEIERINRRNGTLFRPDPELPVEPDDILLIVSDESAIARLSEAR